MLDYLWALQILSLIAIFFFIAAANILTLWYLAGIYLFFLGLLLLLEDGDILVGFLWAIDLGVGLIFFIFILHFSNFLHQKSVFALSDRAFFFCALALCCVYTVFFSISDQFINDANHRLRELWFFLITWYNYYIFFFNQTITDLSLLREIYFFNNSFEFFIINFALFYGIFGAINACLLIRRVFNFLNLHALKNTNLLSAAGMITFIRNQNFLRQQNASTGVRVWTKKKHNSSDF